MLTGLLVFQERQVHKEFLACKAMLGPPDLLGRMAHRVIPVVLDLVDKQDPLALLDQMAVRDRMASLERLGNKDPPEDRDYKDQMDSLDLQALQDHLVYPDQQDSREARDPLDRRET